MGKDDKKVATAISKITPAKVLEEADHKMKKAVEKVLEEHAAIRTGRASAALLDRIEADYYGTPTPIKQIASVSLPDVRTLLLTPYDKLALAAIEKAIQKSDLGLNPSNDGQVIRLVFPLPTEERRKELVKLAKKEAEEGKVAIRNVRRDEIEKLKALEKKGELAQDESKHLQAELQKATDRYNGEIERALAVKEAEIMEV
ncbi:MAG: ribosome recycling factor [Cyanobacteria bacterium NC_groundwater_1444_Ag_S-0.65um_54_12]|nr:ribosome recycling factor [Cyanobacteria bacterium NC_groundwater_1444_Ag_S-0.65um_54_12]